MAGNWPSNLTPDRVMQARRKLEGVAGTRPAFAAIAVSESVALEIERDDTDRGTVNKGTIPEAWAGNYADYIANGDTPMIASPEHPGGNKASRIKAALHDLGLVHFIRKDIG